MPKVSSTSAPMSFKRVLYRFMVVVLLMVYGTNYNDCMGLSKPISEGCYATNVGITTAFCNHHFPSINSTLPRQTSQIF